MTTDFIQRNILLRASLQRVWRALADSAEFGVWFGVRFDEPFAPGAVMRGVVTPTKVDADVANAQKKYSGMPFEITVEQMKPEELLSFRWHPFALEPGVDYSSEPTTLVVFVLKEAEDGVLLTVTESGFDQIPLARRAKAFTANEGGWAAVTHLLAQYVSNAQ